MLDVLSIGTISIDLYYKGKELIHTGRHFELEIGAKYGASSFHTGLGGGGANVAIGIQKNGLHAGLIAIIGNNPFQSIIREKLESEKVTYKPYTRIVDEYWNISSILLNTNGERTIINYRSPHQHIFTSEQEHTALESSRSIFMASLAQVSLTERIKVLAHAKRHGLRTYANLNATDCKRSLEELLHFLQHVDVLIINTHEFAEMVKTSYESIDFHTDVAKKYSLFRPELMLVLTDGRKGSFAYINRTVLHVPAVHGVEVVDTTGAGDGYTAAFIASYQKDERLQAAMQAGSAYAARILGVLGAN